ncbi:MAG: hypothetical protein ACRDRL_29050 [Sciscionella sp.]
MFHLQYQDSARAFGVSWVAAMAAVSRHGRPLVDGPAGTAATTSLGMDETTFLLVELALARSGRPKSYGRR